MASTVDELTVTYVEDGLETIKQLDKIVLTKGAWSTIIYRYQDWNRSKEEYGPDKYTIRRYQKRNGEYQCGSQDLLERLTQDWFFPKCGGFSRLACFWFQEGLSHYDNCVTTRLAEADRLFDKRRVARQIVFS